MRKETALAIFAGISIGLIAAFGIWKATSSIKKNVTETIATQSPTTKPVKEKDFTISNLLDFDVITESPIKIIGTAKQLSNVIVSTLNDDYFAKADEEGSFEIEVELPISLSEVKFVNYDSKGEMSELKLKLVYSSEFKKYIDDSKKSKAYVGTITDISEGTIQIKAMGGEILQAGVNEETEYINTLKKNISVKSTDLAIGDYVVAMGLLNGNKVLSTKRILITGELVDDKRQVVWGKITEITKKLLTITKNDGETLDISLPKTWNGPDTDELEKDQIVITSNELVGETYTLRSIFTPVE